MDDKCTRDEQKERLIVIKSKMKRIKLLPIGLITTLIFTTLFLGVNRNAVQNIEQGEHPGYEEQYFLMKQNAKGEVPKSLWRQWIKETPKFHAKTGFFKEVNELGPTNIGGRVISMIIDSENANHFICGGATGGIWNSYDAGATWKPNNDLAPNLAVSSITQNPFNPKEIYYATGGRPKQAGSISYSGDGLFKSIDGGKTFQFMDSSDIPAFDNSWDIVYSLTDSNTFYVGTLQHGLYRSRDKGLTYELIYNTTGSDVYDVDVTKEGRVYFSVYTKGIFYFDEAETPEVKQFEITSDYFHRCAVAPSASDTNVIYAAFARALSTETDILVGTYKSTNRGKTWTKLANASLRTRHFDQNWFNFVLDVDPKNPNFVIVGGVEASYSTNGGSSWGVLRTGHVDYHGLTFDPNTNYFYALNDGGIYRYTTSSPGSFPSDRNNTLNITQVYCGSFFPTGDKLIIGNQDNNTLLNGGGNGVFSQQLGGDGAFNAVSDDGNVMYGSSQFGVLYRNTTGSWTSYPYNRLAAVVGTNDFWFINPFSLNETDGAQLYFPTKNYIARTLNGGNSWNVITNLISGSAYCIGLTPEDDPDLYYGGQSGILYRINAAKNASPGNSFRMFTLAPMAARGGFIGCIKVDPNEFSTIYVGYTNYSTNPRIWKIIKANTENPEWVDISGNLPTSLPVNWIEIDPLNSDNIIVGTDFGLYVSANGGQFWHKEELIPNVHISTVKIRPSDRKLFITTYGRGVFTATLEDNIQVSTRDKQGFTTEVKLFPNPAQNFVEISGMNWTSVEFINSMGQTMTCNKLGVNKFDVSNLTKGVYFAVVKEDNKKEVIRFIKN